MWKVPTLIIATIALASSAAITQEHLMYKGFAREESNKAFLAKLEIGKAESDMARAQFLHEKNVKLRPTKVVSEFEYMDGLMRLMEAQFAVKRGAYHLQECLTREENWKLRAEAAGEGIEPNKLVAANHVKLAKARLSILNELKTSLKPYLELLNQEYTSSENLAAKRAITEVEFNRITILRNDYVGLQQALEEELKSAAFHLERANEDFATF